MTKVLKSNTDLIVPSSVRRRARMKSGDKIQFDASPGIITITSAQVTYKPTNVELAMIRRGEAAFAKGEYITLAELSRELDSIRHKARKKAPRKASH